MSEVIDQLHQDHVNIVKLLDYLESELAKLGGDRTPDFQLMHEIMHYMTSYPDIYHHPREDVIFGRLKGRPGVDDSAIDEVLAEHQKIYRRGKRFRAALRTVLSESMMLTEEFLDIANKYIRLQRRHLDREETSLFKLAREKLSEAEWQEIDSAFHDVPDPLFGRLVKAEYSHIRGVIG